MNRAESENRFSRFHQVHPVPCDCFEIGRIFLKQADLFMTIGRETLKIFQMGFLAYQIILHVRKTRPLGIEGESQR